MENSLSVYLLQEPKHLRLSLFLEFPHKADSFHFSLKLWKPLRPDFKVSLLIWIYFEGIIFDF